MSITSKPFLRYISFILLFCFIFTNTGIQFVNAAPALSQQTEQKQPKEKLVADIGEIPNKLPKAKLELKNKRTKYSTRYLNPDGSFTEEIFLEAKFYQDPSDKKWKEINNNLMVNSLGKNENTANDFKVSFAHEAVTNELVSIEKNEKNIALIPIKGNQTVGSVKEDQITYTDLFPMVDARYQLKGDSVKEDLILKSNKAQNTFSFEVKLKGVKAAVEEEGIIVFLDKKGNKI